MTTKLTLTLDSGIIEDAKRHAKAHRISLSKLVEMYLQSICKSRDKERIVSPIVDELSGLGSLNSVKSDKELLMDALSEKYI